MLVMAEEKALHVVFRRQITGDIHGRRTFNHRSDRPGDFRMITIVNGNGNFAHSAFNINKCKKKIDQQRQNNQ